MIHRILSQEICWILRFTLKEENQNADYITKLAFVRKDDLQLVETPPEATLACIKADKKRSFSIPHFYRVT